jgi:hypothetical protein
MAQTASKRSILVRDLSDDALATAKNIIPFDIEVHNLRAKVYLNCPLEDLVPEEYALLAEKSGKPHETERGETVLAQIHINISQPSQNATHGYSVTSRTMKMVATSIWTNGPTLIFDTNASSRS